jgi:Na+-translocating ferredoxin:NAD+ oxidoreductase RnfC subunit
LACIFTNKLPTIYATNSIPDTSEFSFLTLYINFDWMHKVGRWGMFGAAFKTPLSSHIVECALPEVASAIHTFPINGAVCKTRIRIQRWKVREHVSHVNSLGNCVDCSVRVEEGLIAAEIQQAELLLF